MRLLRTALVGTAIAVLAYAAIAQITPQVTSQLLSGNEVVRTSVGGPGGQEVLTTISTIRSAIPERLFGSGGTITVTPVDNYLILTAGSLTITFNLPNPAPAGDIAFVCNGAGTAETSVTVVTVAGTQTQTLATTYNAQALAAHTCVRFIFDLPTLTWYQM